MIIDDDRQQTTSNRSEYRHRRLMMMTTIFSLLFLLLLQIHVWICKLQIANKKQDLNIDKHIIIIIHLYYSE